MENKPQKKKSQRSIRNNNTPIVSWLLKADKAPHSNYPSGKLKYILVKLKKDRTIREYYMISYKSMSLSSADLACTKAIALSLLLYFNLWGISELDRLQTNRRSHLSLSTTTYTPHLYNTVEFSCLAYQLNHQPNPKVQHAPYKSKVARFFRHQLPI